uniref:Acyltransferase n=1 Tax=Alexandrium monilatum TaxID=311494 RepID=A0A7S4QVL5_9DINO
MLSTVSAGTSLKDGGTRRVRSPGRTASPRSGRPRLPVPRPLAEAEEIVPTAPPVRNKMAHQIACYVVHNMRCYGHVPGLVLLLRRFPRSVGQALVLYWLLRRTDAWNSAVHHAIQFGSSRRPRFLRARREPYDPNKQYVVAHHPHGILLCSWFNWLGREEGPSPTDPSDCGFSTRVKALDGLPVNLCFAPAVQFMALHGEMYRDKVTDASASTLRSILRRTRDGPVKESVAICPGGFSEAVYTGFSDKHEVAFLEGRKGFLKIAIEEGVDIITTYTFGAADMYKTSDWLRHERAVWSQKTGVPLVMWSGRYGTNLPHFEDTVTVCFDPFPASQYSPEDLALAHEDYCRHLKTCFDAYKGCCATSRSKELVIIGKSTRPPKDVAQPSKL